MIKRFVVVIILLGVLVGGLVGFNMFRAKMIGEFFASQSIPPVTISAAEAVLETWPDYLEAIGTVRAIEGIDVAPQVSGIIKSIGFKPNDEVSAGTVLFQIDDDIEQAELRLFESDLALGRTVLDRVRLLREQGNAPQSTLDEAVAAVNRATAQVERTRAEIQKKRIEAPFSGTVGISVVDPGQYVAPGDRLVTLQRLDRVHVDFTLPERAITQVAMDQPVELRIDAFEDRVFKGQITGIEPRIDETSRTILIRATLDNSDRALKPGFFARVRVLLPARPEIVTVPQTAVTFSLYGDSVFIVRQSDGAEGGQPSLTVEQVFVQVGQRRDGSVEIVSGIEAGTTVVTSGQLKLQNGYPVVIDNTVDPSRPLARTGI